MRKASNRPVYHGMKKHVDTKGGYSLWLPSDWYKFELESGHGAVYSPYRDSHETRLSAEKRTLDYAVSKGDVPVLREGFADGLAALPDIQIESQDETITSTLITFEARYTFTDQGQTRKRWTRLVYWGEGQLILMAQAATPEEFQYWLPMFYNTMMTVEL